MQSVSDANSVRRETDGLTAPMEFDSLPLISADSHVEEPRDLWAKNLPPSLVENLAPELRDGHSPSGSFADRIGVENLQRIDALTRSDDAVEMQSMADLTTDPERRLAVMRQDGIAGECIYPTMGLYVWNAESREAGEAACRLYNDWIFDRLERRSSRFRCAAMIPTWDVGAAIAEIRRTAAMGLAAALLPLVGTPEYNHRDWESLWNELDEIGMPVVMHQGTGHSMLFYRGPGAAVANLLATQSMAPRGATLLATSGVLAAHPDLHFVFVETNASWLAWAMNTADHYDRAFRQYPGWVRPELREKPSVYMARQIHGTFQYDPVAVASIAQTGSDPLLWGSDFPHAEGTYPHSRASVAEQFAGVAEEQVARMVGGTAAKLFGFAPEVSNTPV